MEYSKNPGQQMEKSKTVTQNQVSILFARKEENHYVHAFLVIHIFLDIEINRYRWLAFCVIHHQTAKYHTSYPLYYPGPWYLQGSAQACLMATKTYLKHS